MQQAYGPVKTVEESMMPIEFNMLWYLHSHEKKCGFPGESFKAVRGERYLGLLKQAGICEKEAE